MTPWQIVARPKCRPAFYNSGPDTPLLGLQLYNSGPNSRWWENGVITPG
jgi:hypothetical protein